MNLAEQFRLDGKVALVTGAVYSGTLVKTKIDKFLNGGLYN